MIIEVLHIDECPNWEQAEARVREALARRGDTSTAVTGRLVQTREEAAQVPFAGSPTITLDGDDLFPNEGQTTDLACRVYVTRNGLAGLPTVEQIVEALETRMLR
ncbi:hypothetical protein GCM10027414_28940 [Humibacter ginsengiterrae]